MLFFSNFYFELSIQGIYKLPYKVYLSNIKYKAHLFSLKWVFLLRMPDFSSFFIGRQKINYNYLVIIFFPSADSFGVLAIYLCKLGNIYVIFCDFAQIVSHCISPVLIGEYNLLFF